MARKFRFSRRHDPPPEQQRKLNALEETKKASDEGPHPLYTLLAEVFGHIPVIRSLLDLKEETLNYDTRNLYFNTPIPDEELDSKTQQPKAKYATNKVRTTKYTPLNFLPKNILFQFQNVANIYFLMVAIFSGFTIFGVNNPGLASVPIIVIVVVTAIRDGFEDWRRHILDLELNNTVTTILENVPNENTPLGNVGPWRRFKKSCSHFYSAVWNKMRHKRDPLSIDDADRNDNQSISSSSILREERARIEGKPVFVGKYWKDVRVGDFVKVYADEAVPADMVILSSSDPEGDCFIDTRSLDGETSLKARRAVRATRHVRRSYQVSELAFKLDVEGANADLNSFGWTFTDVKTGNSEAIGTANFLPRGSNVRNSRWVIGYVVYTGVESKIILNAGQTPTKRSRLARDLNLYVACSFIFLFAMCFISGVVEGVKFRDRTNTAYFFEYGLLTKNAALNGFVTFFAAMLVLQNLVPISLYVSIEIARTFLAYFIYSDAQIYDEVTDYPCTPKSWALSDDLGQIEFIFSDKTGTLTQNSMVFRKCSINGKAYGTAFTEAMAGQIKRNKGDADKVRATMSKQIREEQDNMRWRLNKLYKNPYVSEDPNLVSEPIVADLQGSSGRDQVQMIEKFVLTLALCNTVVTEVRLESDFQDIDRILSSVGDDDRRKSMNLAQRIMSSQSATGDETQNLDLAYPQPRRSVGSGRSRTSRDYNELRRSSAGMYGRKSLSSARPKQSLDYRRMEGKVLLHKAESPDESALVTMARDLGYTLVEESKHHKIIDMQGSFHRFDVLQTLLFTSHRKRMSVLVRNEAGRYFLLAKGADSIMETLLTNESRNSSIYEQTAKDLEKFAEEGLRTLMIAYREVDADFAEDWSHRVDEVSALPNRDDLIEGLAVEIEHDLTLLGGTGIEDQLQEDVPDTIEILGRAGIKLWMLTGDKVETAVSIGFSCNLLNSDMDLLVVKSPEELGQRLQELGLEATEGALAAAGADHRPPQGKHALIIDGSVLAELVSNKEHRMQFALLGKKCKSVLCCRVSPSQKAAVVHIMKSAFDVTTLAVGDGANDVSMIQEADIGVGIVGVEGRQAAMSSDFAIGQFRFLQRLILVHGRWSYQRVASMIHTLLYENFMFSMTLFWYNIWAQFDQSYLYDYTYLVLFNSLFVSFPVVMRGIFDQDVSDKMLLKYPELYGDGILRKAWTVPMYIATVADGLYQSAVAYFFAYSIFFTGKFYTINGHDLAYRQGMGTLVCATAVYACNTYVLLGQRRWDWISLAVFLISGGILFAWTGIYTSAISSNFFYHSAAQVYDTLVFWAYFLLSFVAALLPRFTYNTVRALWFPSDVDIIREEEFISRHGKRGHDHSAHLSELGESTQSSESAHEKPAKIDTL